MSGAGRCGEQRIDITGRDATPVGVVDFHHWRDRAGEGAVHLFQRDGAIGRRPAGGDAERSLARPYQISSSARPAAYAGADADDSSAGPGEPELGIVARDSPHLALRDAQVGRDPFERVGREPPVGALRRVKRRQEPRALAGEGGGGRCGVAQIYCSSFARKSFSTGAHFAHSGPLAEWPSSVSISKYCASTPAFRSLSITAGAIDGGKSLSVLEST
jgi:hypothetical protein